MNTEPLRSVAAIDSADGADRRCRWFQLRSFITGNQMIISDQFVSPVCSSVMNFPIVTTSTLFCDSMIEEIAQIGHVRKIPCREIFSAGYFRVFTALVR